MPALVEYADAVTTGKILACDKIKRVYDRLAEDVVNPRGAWHFSEKRANRPIQFIEKFCRQSQGLAGKPFTLELFQKAMIQAVFGFLDDDDFRRFREFLEIIARKNGKTTILSGLELYMLLGDNEGAPEIYNIATAREQAMKGYTECLNMRAHSALIQKHTKKRQSDLYCSENLGFIKPLASNTNSLDGLNAHFVVIDELAAIKKRDLYDLMKQSLSARNQGLLGCITTNGFIRNSIYDDQYAYASAVIEGKVKDDRFLPLIYEQDDRSEWQDESMWIKSNPGLDAIKKRSVLQDSVKKAQSDDSYRPTVMVKDFNLTENSNSAWLSWEELNNAETFDFAEMKFRYGIGGFDAADSVDLCAAKMICKRRNDGKIYVKSMYWIPQSKLEVKNGRHHPDDAPYDLWESRGLVTVVPGNRVDKRVVLEWFRDMRDKEDCFPLYIGFDPWHVDETLLNAFKGEFGETVMIPIRQGVATLSQPMKDLKAEFQAHNVIYNNNPVDKWCLANTYAKSDVNNNIQPDKSSSENKRIDGTAALLDAYVIYEDKKDEYENLI